jgi:hypothetical protein
MWHNKNNTKPSVEENQQCLISSRVKISLILHFNFKKWMVCNLQGFDLGFFDFVMVWDYKQKLYFQFWILIFLWISNMWYDVLFHAGEQQWAAIPSQPSSRGEQPTLHSTGLPNCDVQQVSCIKGMRDLGHCQVTMGSLACYRSTSWAVVIFFVLHVCSGLWGLHYWRLKQSLGSSPEPVRDKAQDQEPVRGGAGRAHQGSICS